MPRKFAPAILVLALVGGCSLDYSQPPSSASTSVTPSIGVAGSGPTSSVAPSATEPAEGYPLPSSLPREDVPWVEVGEGWYVVLYEASQVDLVAGTPFVSGPVVLYLVNQSGIRYEVVRWEPESGPLGLVDAWATTALVAGVGTADEETLYEAVDLVTGEVMPVYSVALPNRNHTISRELSLSRTNAENLVIYRLDGVSEFLERRSFDGAVLATLYDGDYVSQLEALQWLDHHDGTSLLVSSSNGIAHVSNDGAELGEVLIPADFRCDPVRWWDAETFLSACYLRSFGEPESGLDSPVNYGQLWLLEENGAEGVALTGLPVEAPDFFRRLAKRGKHPAAVAWGMRGSKHCDFAPRRLD
jgi:hypothetical protein